MIERLPEEAYPRLAPLVEPLAARNLILAAVVEGSSPATVYTDNAAAPNSALIASAEGHFLVGQTDNKRFNDALRDFLQRTFFAGEREAWREELVFACHPEGWTAALYDEIVPFRPPFASKRRYYHFDAPATPTPAPPSAGMQLRPIDGELRAQSDGVNVHDIEFWVTKNWGTWEAFLARGFGVCLMDGTRIVSWSLADCVAGEACEIGIETDEAYRRRGLATVVTGAMVAEAQARGYQRIGWHCWEHNLGSIGVAEKVGFVHRESYPEYVCHEDPLMHKAIQGYAALRARDFETAQRWYAEVAAMEGAPDWAPFQLARCYAMLGKPDASLDALRQAVALGWREREETVAHPDFESLRNDPAWLEILAAMA